MSYNLSHFSRWHGKVNMVKRLSRMNVQFPKKIWISQPPALVWREVYFGHSIMIALWLCLQSWIQALQRRLYSILPLQLMNMLISSRFFWLILGILLSSLKTVWLGVVFACFLLCKAWKKQGQCYLTLLMGNALFSWKLRKMQKCASPLPR